MEDSSESFIVVPYQPPVGKRLWDRLQIKAQIPLDVPIRSMDNNQVDFVIIMINPNHDPVHVQAYLKEVISDLIKLYEQSGQERQSNEGSTSSNHQHQPQLYSGKKPLCLCFLNNFRDLQLSKKQGIQESEVKQYALDILRENAEKLPSNDQLLLQFGTTSLFNCFGLSTLHHFIYSAYLRSKRAELELQLLEVHEEVSRSGEAPRTKYKDFLKLLGATTSEKKKRDQEVHNVRKDPRVQQSFSQKGAGEGVEHGTDQPLTASSGGNRRQVVSSKFEVAHMSHQSEEEQPQAPPYENNRSALEAFLASDSEEEGTANLASKSKRQHFTSDDDDDDDDYFYNEAGEKCTVHGGISKKQALNSASNGSEASASLSKLSKEEAELSIAQSNNSDKSGLEPDLSSSSGRKLDTPHINSGGAPVESEASVGESPGHSKESSIENRGQHESATNHDEPQSPTAKGNNSESRHGLLEESQQPPGSQVSVSQDDHRVLSRSSDSDPVSADGTVTLASSSPDKGSDDVSKNKIEKNEANARDEITSSHSVASAEKEDHSNDNDSESNISECANGGEELHSRQPGTELKGQVCKKLDISNNKDENVAVKVGHQDNVSVRAGAAPSGHVIDQKDRTTDEDGLGGTTNNDGPPEISSSNEKSAKILPAKLEYSDDEDEEFFIDETVPMPNEDLKPIASAAAATDGDDDDDSGEFFVESVEKTDNCEDGSIGVDQDEKERTADRRMDEGNSSEEDRATCSVLTVDAADTSSGTKSDKTIQQRAPPAPPGSSVTHTSISAAAQAAIAAAQKEAELMLQQSLVASSNEVKSKKDKKKKEKKDKKKKDKKKSKRRETSDSDG